MMENHNFNQLFNIFHAIKPSIKAQIFKKHQFSQGQNFQRYLLYTTKFILGLTKYEIIKVVYAIADKIGEIPLFAEFIGSTFKYVWVNTMIGLQFEDDLFCKILSYDYTSLCPLDFKRYISQLGKSLEIEKLSNNAQAYANQIQKNNIWKQISKIYPTVYLDKEQDQTKNIHQKIEDQTSSKKSSKQDAKKQQNYIQMINNSKADAEQNIKDQVSMKSSINNNSNTIRQFQIEKKQSSENKQLDMNWQSQNISNYNNEYMHSQSNRNHENSQQYSQIVSNRTSSNEFSPRKIGSGGISKEVLNHLKEQLKLAKDSILDQLILQNLIQSLQSELNKQNSYKNIDYENFKTQFLKIVTQMGLNSGELKLQLISKYSKSQGIFKKILNIRSKLHPIYLPQLIYLIQKNNQAKNVVLSKDIVVVLGTTGAGKSTLAQHMLGYKLQEQKNEYGITTLAPIDGLKPQHKQIAAKVSSKSITKYVSAIQLKLPPNFSDEGQIFLADTPGFFDSQGLIANASNSLSTIKTLGTANSIRIILLINSKNLGTGCEGFKKLAKIISKIFTKYDKKSVLYFLNCFSDKELKQLPNKLIQMRDNLNAQERGDNKFRSVVNQFCLLLETSKKMAESKKISINEAIKCNEQLVIMNPLQDDLNEIFQKVLNEKRKIGDPSKVLDNVISSQVKSALQNQVHVLEVIIEHYIKQQKFKTAKYYINLLTRISKETKQINDIGDEKIKLNNIKYKIQENYNNLYKKFERSLQNNVLSLRISQADVLQIKQYQRKLENQQKWYQQIQMLKDISKPQQLYELIKQISNKIQQKFGSQFSQDLIQTIRLFSKHFDQKLHQKFAKKISERLKSIQLQIKNIIASGNYQNLQQSIKQQRNILDKVNKIKGVKVDARSWQPELQKNIAKNNQICQKIIKNNEQGMKLQNIIKIKQVLKQFSSIGQYPTQKQSRDIYNAYKKIKSKIINLTKGYINMIKQSINYSAKQQNLNINEIQILIKYKSTVEQLIQEIRQVKQQLDQQFKNHLKKIPGLVDANILNINEKINQIGEQNWSAVKPIHFSIKMLQIICNLCQNEQTRNECYQIVKQVKHKLINKLKDLQQYLISMNFNQQTPSQEILIVLKAIQINLIEERHEQQQHQQEQIMKVSMKIKNTIDQKITNAFCQIQIFMKNMQSQNIQNIQNSFSRIIKIQRLLADLKNKNYRNTKVSIQKAKNTFISNLKSVIQHLSKKVAQIVQQALKDGTINISKQQVAQINKIRSIIAKIKNNQSLSKDLIQYFEDIFAKQEGSINNQLLKLKHYIQQLFQQIQNVAGINMCLQILQKCKPLRYLKEFNSQQDTKFTPFLQNLKQRVDKLLTQNNFNADTSSFIKKENIDYSLFKKIYYFLKQNPTQRLKYNNLIISLKTVLKQEQRQLETYLLVKNYKIKSNISDEDIQKIYNKIKNYLTNIQKANQIIEDERQKIQVGQQIMKKVTFIVRRLVDAIENKIKKHIQQGLLSYNLAEQLIQKIEYFGNLFKSLNIKEYIQYIQNKQKSLENKSIQEYYTSQILKNRQKLKAKYGKKQIIIDDNFISQFSFFNESDKLRIELIIVQQFDSQLEKFKQSKPQNQQAVKNKQKQMLKTTKYLTPDLKKKIEDRIQKWIASYLKQIQNDVNKALKNFSIKNAFQLTQNEDRPMIITTYMQLIKKHFEQTFSKLYSQQNLENIIKIIRDSFIQNFNGKNLQKTPKLKQLFNGQCQKLASFVNSMANISLQKINQYLNQNLVQNKQKVAVQNIKDTMDKVVRFIAYVIQHKQLLKYDQNIVVQNLKKIMKNGCNNFGNKYHGISWTLSYQKMKNNKLLGVLHLQFQCLQYMNNLLFIHLTNLYNQNTSFQHIKQIARNIYYRIDEKVS